MLDARSRARAKARTFTASEVPRWITSGGCALPERSDEVPAVGRVRVGEQARERETKCVRGVSGNRIGNANETLLRPYNLFHPEGS